MRTSKVCRSCLALIDYRQDRHHCHFYCSDDQDKLLPREIVHRHVRYFFQAWQQISKEESAIRAEHLLNAMPAWAQ